MNPLQKIEHIKTRILNLGPMLPGSISQQWNVCGVASCRCKDPVEPKKHGPYFQLSFSIKGKSSSMFLQKDDVAEARRRIKRYQDFKDLSFELMRACVELARTEGLSRKEIS